MPATIQCRIFVFEITVSEFTDMLLCLLSHKRMYTLSTWSTFISVYWGCYMSWLLWKTILS